MQRHPEFEDIKETISGEGSARTAVCEIKGRANPGTNLVTMGEAAKAGLC